MASARIDHPYKTVGNFKFEGEDSSIYIWTQEIARLSEEVAGIQLRLAQLTAQVVALDDFELVDSASVSEPPRVNPAAKASSFSGGSYHRPAVSSVQSFAHTEIEREEAARQTGLFFPQVHSW